MADQRLWSNRWRPKDAGDALYAYLHGPTDTSGAVEIADAVETWAARYPATLQVVYSNFRLSP